MDYLGGPARWAIRLAAYAVCIFVAVPIVVVIGTSVTHSNYVTFPPDGFTLKWYVDALSDWRIRSSLRVSFTVAAAAATIATLFGLAASLVLERSRFRGRSLVTTMLMAPLAVPAIVLALGMLFFMTALGLIRTLQGLILGHLVVTLPYAVRAISTAMAGVDQHLERSAAILGASPFKVLAKVTLPLIRSGIVAAVMFAFLASFNNVTVSLFLVGARTQTLPITIFRISEVSLSPSLSAIASLVMLVTITTMMILERRFGIYGVLEKGRSL